MVFLSQKHTILCFLRISTHIIAPGHCLRQDLSGKIIAQNLGAVCDFGTMACVPMRPLPADSPLPNSALLFQDFFPQPPRRPTRVTRCPKIGTSPRDDRAESPQSGPLSAQIPPGSPPHRERKPPPPAGPPSPPPGPGFHSPGGYRSWPPG